MWLIIGRAGSGGKLHSRIFLFEQTQSIGTLTGDWSCELCRETNIDFNSILLHLMQIFSTLWWHFVFFMIFAFLCPMCWISRYLKANSPAAADMEDLGAGGKYRVRLFFFAASSKASEKEKSIFFTKRPHPLLVASSDSASLLIGLMPPVDQPDFLVCF